MLRELTDKLNSSAAAAHATHGTYPDEQLRFATAVTCLETTSPKVQGWTLRRVLQRRGNAVITDQRLIVQSNPFSLYSLLWLCLFAYFAWRLYVDQQPQLLLFMALAFLFLWQRRPYRRDIMLTQLKNVSFGTVRGILARADTMSFDSGGGHIHLATSKRIPDDVRNLITPHNA